MPPPTTPTCIDDHANRSTIVSTGRHAGAGGERNADCGTSSMMRASRRSFGSHKRRTCAASPGGGGGFAGARSGWLSSPSSSWAGWQRSAMASATVAATRRRRRGLVHRSALRRLDRRRRHTRSRTSSGRGEGRRPLSRRVPARHARRSHGDDDAPRLHVAAASLPPGRYHWRVWALDRSGGRVGRPLVDASVNHIRLTAGKGGPALECGHPRNRPKNVERRSPGRKGGPAGTLCGILANPSESSGSCRPTRPVSTGRSCAESLDLVINLGDACEAIVRSVDDCCLPQRTWIRASSGRFSRRTRRMDSLAEASSWAARTLLPRAQLMVATAAPERQDPRGKPIPAGAATRNS